MISRERRFPRRRGHEGLAKSQPYTAPGFCPREPPPCRKKIDVGYLTVTAAGAMTPFSLLFSSPYPQSNMTRPNAVSADIASEERRTPKPSVRVRRWVIVGFVCHGRRSGISWQSVHLPMGCSCPHFQPSILTSPLEPCPAARMWRTLLHRISTWPRAPVIFWSMYSSAPLSWMFM